MAYALLGQVDKCFRLASANPTSTTGTAGRTKLRHTSSEKWEVVSGTVNHYWHGSKQHRRYQDRWKILVGDGYDPELDIKYDFQGVLQLTGRNIKLRDDLIQYFNVRNEDSIDL